MYTNTLKINRASGCRKHLLRIRNHPSPLIIPFACTNTKRTSFLILFRYSRCSVYKSYNIDIFLHIFDKIHLFCSDTPRFSCSVAKPSHDIDASVPGEIVSPGYPGTYSSNQDCIWKLKAPLASLVRIKITNLNLDQSDFLTISDGETAFPGNLIGK